MDRIIKFKAWDKVLNKFVGFYSNGLYMYENGQIYTGNMNVTSRYILLQYVGLDDKNDKEIYEGDILEEKYNDEVYNYYVEWSKDEARFMLMPILQEKIYIFGFGDYGKDDIHNYEVIGNIYENPELLEVKIDEN